MKSLATISSFVLMCFLILRCGTGRQSFYNIGDDVPPEVREKLVERAEKGKILFRNHCTGCHGIFQKAKDSVPDFTRQQIDAYESVALKGFNGHGILKKVSVEQLDYIITFLRLRKIEK